MDCFVENKTFSYSQLQIFLNLGSELKFKQQDFNYIAIDCATGSMDALNIVLLMIQKNIQIPDNVINAVSLNITKTDIRAWRSVHILLELGNQGNICALQILNTLISEVIRIITIKINSSLGNKVYEDIIIPLSKSEYEIIRNIMTECAKLKKIEK